MTDARVSREYLDALVSATPSLQVSREHVEVLALATPSAQISRVMVEVLCQAGPTITYWNGAAEVAVTPEGWGPTSLPFTIEGWWDGSAIQPLG